MTKIHKVHTSKTAKPKPILGFSGIRAASSSKPKLLQKHKTQAVIRLKGHSVHKQSESKLSHKSYHKEIRNIETEDIQTQTPNLDHYE